MLSVLEQNPTVDWRSLIGQAEPEHDAPVAAAEDGGDDTLATLKL